MRLFGVSAITFFLIFLVGYFLGVYYPSYGSQAVTRVSSLV